MENIKADYFKHHLEEGFRKTFAAQLEKSNAIYGRAAYSHGRPRQRSGRLRDALQSPDYFVKSSQSGAEAVAFYPTYIRLLDMRKFGNRKIYNRPVWGIFYKQTLKDMKNDFVDWLKEQTMRELTEAILGKS